MTILDTLLSNLDVLAILATTKNANMTSDIRMVYNDLVMNCIDSVNMDDYFEKTNDILKMWSNRLLDVGMRAFHHPSVELKKCKLICGNSTPSIYVDELPNKFNEIKISENISHINFDDYEDIKNSIREFFPRPHLPINDEDNTVKNPDTLNSLADNQHKDNYGSFSIIYKDSMNKIAEYNRVNNIFIELYQEEFINLINRAKAPVEKSFKEIDIINMNGSLNMDLCSEILHFILIIIQVMLPKLPIFKDSYNKFYNELLFYANEFENRCHEVGL